MEVLDLHTNVNGVFSLTALNLLCLDLLLKVTIPDFTLQVPALPLFIIIFIYPFFSR